MCRARILPGLFAVMAICIAATGSAGAQAASPAVRENAAPRPAARPAAPRPAPARRDTAQANRSVSERLFDAGWVVLPARLALVAVCLTIALLLVMFGVWSALRVAHSLRHTRWSEPPRRLKRGEFGAAGTSVALEFEERLSSNTENDREQDRQIALVREALRRLDEEHSAFETRLTSIEILAGVRPDD